MIILYHILFVSVPPCVCTFDHIPYSFPDTDLLVANSQTLLKICLIY